MTVNIDNVLEWTNYPNEGPVALMTYGGPTVCVTVDPLTLTGVVIHWAHGQDSEIVRQHDPKMRHLLQAIPVGELTYLDHPDKDKIPEIFAHMLDDSLDELLFGANAGGQQ